MQCAPAPELTATGSLLCKEGMRYCRDGLWSGCEGLSTFLAPPPGKLALRAGVAYEGRAVPVEYMNIDSWPVAKRSLHLGATAAFDRLRVSLAYAHVFYQPIEMDVGVGGVKEIVSQSANKAQPVNEGYYSAAQDVLSGQLNVGF